MRRLSDEELEQAIGSDASKVVAADDAASKTKSSENGNVVIVKNGKKFTVIGSKE